MKECPHCHGEFTLSYYCQLHGEKMGSLAELREHEAEKHDGAQITTLMEPCPHVMDHLREVER